MEFRLSAIMLKNMEVILAGDRVDISHCATLQSADRPSAVKAVNL